MTWRMTPGETYRWRGIVTRPAPPGPTQMSWLPRLRATTQP
jgi:hypothetical protein